MICPHCKKDIPDEQVAKHIAAKGGSKSKRTITPEQQAKMQHARRNTRNAAITNAAKDSDTKSGNGAACGA